MKLQELAGLYGDAGVKDYAALGQDPGLYAALEGMARYSAVIAAANLISLSEAGLVELTKPKRMVDFGAGRGGPTFALALLAEENGGQVDAIEPDRGRAKDIERTGLTEHMPVRLHMTEGVEWLRGQAAEGNRYDLITAFMFGPDKEGELAELLLEAAQAALDEDGKLIINSDKNTMAAARQACAGVAGATYYYDAPDKFECGTIVVPGAGVEVSDGPTWS